jgi:DNA-binding response OmpR family regulator
MRKPRAIIFDDDVFILNLLKDFFLMEGYEVLTFGDPASLCSIGGMAGDACPNSNACTDVLITDITVPGGNCLELLEHQALKGCKLDSRNKAVISDRLDERSQERFRKLGCSVFRKPFTLYSLSEWLAGCEHRMDLRLPLSTRRKEERYVSYREITFRLPAGASLVSGIALNMSPSGFCLKVPALLRQEQVINIQGGHFHSCQRASVRWVRQIDDGACLAGLRCTSREGPSPVV